MHHHSEPVWIGSAAGSTRPGGCCGTCGGGQDASRPCEVDSALPTCAQPRIDGPPDLVQRALAQLNTVIDPGSRRGLVDAQLIRELSLVDGEAELTLSFPMHCGNAMELGDEAFHALRDLLHDTDIYVRHSS